MQQPERWEAVMSSEDTMPEKARPILNERDYQNAKSLLAKEMRHNNHNDRVWARLEALMQAVADYERRFLEGEEEDAADWIRYAYEAALEETEMPRRRWSDSTEDYLIES
jgi:hypothetical protein